METLRNGNPGGGYLHAKVNGAPIYAPRSTAIQQYEEILDSLLVDTKDVSSKIIPGNFSPRPFEGGRRVTNTEGHVLLGTFY